MLNLLTIGEYLFSMMITFLTSEKLGGGKRPRRPPPPSKYALGSYKDSQLTPFLELDFHRS